VMFGFVTPVIPEPIAAIIITSLSVAVRPEPPLIVLQARRWFYP
jgi:hypothetical protein